MRDSGVRGGRLSEWLTALPRRPSFQFLVLGMALLLAKDRIAPFPQPSRQPPVVMTANRIAHLRQDFLRDLGRAPTLHEEAALLDSAVDEELLYREALARGLDRGDRSVQWRLIEKMEFLGESAREPRAAMLHEATALGLDREDVVIRRMLVQKMRLLAVAIAPDEPVDDRTLEAYMQRHRDEYLEPERVTFRHVFLSAQTRGPALEGEASRLLAQLRSGAPPAEPTIGDIFPGGPIPAKSSQAEITKLLGASFAESVMRLEPGTWSEPIRSAYGVHLVRVEAHEPAQVPELSSVRARLQRAYLAERNQERLESFIHGLRSKYEVRVEAAPPLDG